MSRFKYKQIKMFNSCERDKANRYHDEFGGYVFVTESRRHVVKIVVSDIDYFKKCLDYSGIYKAEKNGITYDLSREVEIEKYAEAMTAECTK